MAITFGEAVRELRKRTGLSQRELAEKVGVDFSYISKVENNRLPPPAADTITNICEALSVPPDKLLALTGKMPTAVKEMVSGSAAAQQFMRQAQTMRLSDDEWGKLSQRLKRLRSG